MDDSIDIQLDTLKISGDPTKLWENLAMAQAEFTAVPKMATGQIGQQKFKYAGYATLMRCVRPALAKYGIAIIQPLHSREDHAVTTTILAGHGASIQTSFSFRDEFTKKLKDGTVLSDPQEFGRHHTYYRRYQLQAMVGIEGDNDADDLPDVNEEKAQFTERSEPKNEAPKEPVKSAATKTEKAAVDSKASTKPSTEPQKPPSINSSAPTAPAGPAGETLKTINARLQSGMEELGWKMDKLKEFYVANVDATGFEKASNLTIEQKTALLDKLVSVAGITPF